MNVESDSDAELIRQAVAGDGRAVTALVSRHKYWLYRFIRRYVGDADEAQDVLQDCLVSAMSNLDRFDVERPFDIWLRRIALNKCRDRGRRLAVRRALGLEMRPALPATETADPGPSAERGVEADEAMAALQRAVAQLAPALRAPLVLTALEGLSQKEAGDVLGISVKAVEVRVYRAKRKLAETLDRADFSSLLPD